MTLKEELFNRTTISDFADHIHRVEPSFPRDTFIEACMQGLDMLELKDRMNHVATQLARYMPRSYPENLDVFERAFIDVRESRFVYGSILRYIEEHGCNDTHLELSLDALGRFTGLFSAEFAIRPFLNDYPNQTMEYVRSWAVSGDVHRRRLASEGTRPSLPWAPNVTLDYRVPLPILGQLYGDSERYVTRSVANHLNDIAKFDPDTVLRTLRTWKKENRQDPKELDYIIRHALRTLIKQGHPGALAMIGFDSDVALERVSLDLKTDRLRIGDTLDYMLTLHTKQPQDLLVDVRITYPTKHGKTTSKVYKWTTVSTDGRTPVVLSGRRPFQHLSTRTMREGSHTIAVQVNGNEVIQRSFELTE
jgi:3-methyladenine DNA glycosylase AlkC